MQAFIFIHGECRNVLTMHLLDHACSVQRREGSLLSNVTNTVPVTLFPENSVSVVWNTDTVVKMADLRK